jgi:hypothetical protein
MSNHVNISIRDIAGLHDVARMRGLSAEDCLNGVLEAELARKERQLAKFVADEESEREAFAKQRHDALVEAKAAGRIV